MKQVIRILSLFLIGINVVSGQQVLLSQEKTYITDEIPALLGKLDDNVLVFGKNGLRYELDIYDGKLQYLKTKELFFDKQKVDIQKAIPLDDQFVIVYSYFYKLDLVSYVRKYNAEGDLLDSLKLPEDETMLDQDSYLTFLSKNNEKLLLVRPKNYFSLEMILIDLKKFEMIWCQNRAFSSYQLERDLAVISVRDNGEVYLVFEKYNFGWQKNKHFQHIYMLMPDDTTIKDLKIPFQGKLTADFDIIFDERNGVAIGAGLYADRSNPDASGHFVYQLKDGQLVKELVFTPFSIRLLRNNQSFNRKIKKEMQDMHIGDIMVKNDGGLMMIIETRKELTRESSRNRYTDYYFEDLYLICTRPDGSLFWDDQIRKYQLSYDDKAVYSSYFLYSTPSAVSLIFNDEIKDESTISEFSFNPLGNGKRRSLFSTDLHRLKLMFSRGIQISSQSFLVPSYAEGKYRLVMVIY